jgi:WD40 repeat protein
MLPACQQWRNVVRRCVAGLAALHLIQGFAGSAAHLIGYTNASTCSATAGSDKPPVVRSLDYDEASSSILVGTLDSCIWEVPAGASTQQQQQQMLVPGHKHDVWAVACHPEQPNIMSSVCDGNKIYVWDLKARQLLRAAPVGFVCRAVTFSAVAYGVPGSAAAGYHIAVGGAQGHIRVSMCNHMTG